jgi:hypothetical protein
LLLERGGRRRIGGERLLEIARDQTIRRVLVERQ